MTARGLEWSDVRAVLDEFGTFRYEVGPYGFTINAVTIHGIADSYESWRVRCGSGIAGRGGHWTIVRVTDGHAFCRPVSTRAALRRAIREHLAGPIPDPRYPERYYATRHSNRFQSGHYIWKVKRYG